MGCFTAALALVGVVAAAVQRPLPPALSVAALAALTAHGSLLFSALLAAGNARFLISLWPAIITAGLFGVAGPFLRREERS